MRACDRERQWHDHFLAAACGGFRFRLASADFRNKSCLAQNDFESAALVATEQKRRERVLKVAFGLFAGLTLRMDIEQVTGGNKPFPLFLHLRRELEFH